MIICGNRLAHQCRKFKNCRLVLVIVVYQSCELCFEIHPVRTFMILPPAIACRMILTGEGVALEEELSLVFVAHAVVVGRKGCLSNHPGAVSAIIAVPAHFAGHAQGVIGMYFHKIHGKDGGIPFENLDGFGKADGK